jgi:DNA-binding MarR family transcriptional regulator
MARSSKWTFLTNHAMVLLQVWQDPDPTVREIADRVGITERAVHRILADLSVNGYVLRRRVGRRTQYSVNPDRPFRHPLVSQLDVARLLEALDPRRRG